MLLSLVKLENNKRKICLKGGKAYPDLPDLTTCSLEIINSGKALAQCKYRLKRNGEKYGE
jgi:hypothetical protein